MNITRTKLETDLKNAGISAGDLLVVHSSLKSLGHVEGGPLTVIEALCNVVGDGGGVMFPCLTFQGSLSNYLQQIDTVDLRKARILTGAIPSAAWENSQSIRSIHPTHPIAGFGGKIQKLLLGLQSDQGPCGTESPFYKAVMADAKILMIGTDMNTCTIVHCAEEIATPYVFSGEDFAIRTIDFNGSEHKMIVKGYSVDVTRDFAKIEPDLINAKITRLHKLGQADLRVIDARKMLSFVLAGLKNEPELLLAKADSSSVRRG